MLKERHVCMDGAHVKLLNIQLCSIIFGKREIIQTSGQQSINTHLRLISSTHDVQGGPVGFYVDMVFNNLNVLIFFQSFHDSIFIGIVER